MILWARASLPSKSRTVVGHLCTLGPCTIPYAQCLQNVHPLIPLGFEPRTFRVLGGCDNHYTMESVLAEQCLRIKRLLGEYLEVLLIW